MNIIYLLTNISKDQNPKYYIGSKLECDIIPVFNIPSIVSLKSGKVYYGSSSNKEMQKDLLDGNHFRAEVLEVVLNRDEVRRRENEWLVELDVANSERYYNLSNNALASFNYESMRSVFNPFGESFTKIAKSRGSIGKRNLTAKSLGFKDYYDLVLYIAKGVSCGKSYAEIAKEIGHSNRHFPAVTTKYFNLSKLLKENPKDYIKDVEDFYFANATIEKIAEILGIEQPTAYRAVLLLIDNFEKPDFISLVVSKKLGMSIDKLETTIAKSVFEKKSLADTARDLGIDRRSATKYFIRFFRRRFNANDFE